MEDDKLLQRFQSPDGKRWFELRQQSDGMFYFQEFSESTDAVPVYGAESYTSPSFRSGLYASAKAAEADLRVEAGSKTGRGVGLGAVDRNGVGGFGEFLKIEHAV